MTRAASEGPPGQPEYLDLTSGSIVQDETAVGPVIDALRPTGRLRRVSANAAGRQETEEPEAELGAPMPTHGDNDNVEMMPPEEVVTTTTGLPALGSGEVPTAPSAPPMVDHVNISVPQDHDTQNEVLVLRNKATLKGQKGRDLDSCAFDADEWLLFREAGAKQWRARIESGTVQTVPENEAKNILRDQILPIPARSMRVNKDKTGDSIIAKSRLVVPGHLAPKGQVRTDAPVAPQIRLHICCMLAAVFSWPIGSFGLTCATHS